MFGCIWGVLCLLAFEYRNSKFIRSVEWVRRTWTVCLFHWFFFFNQSIIRWSRDGPSSSSCSSYLEAQSSKSYSLLILIWIFFVNSHFVVVFVVIYQLNKWQIIINPEIVSPTKEKLRTINNNNNNNHNLAYRWFGVVRYALCMMFGCLMEIFTIIIIIGLCCVACLHRKRNLIQRTIKAWHK